MDTLQVAIAVLVALLLFGIWFMLRGQWAKQMHTEHDEPHSEADAVHRQRREAAIRRKKTR